MLKSSTMKKKITIILFSLIFLKINLFSQVYSQQQVFQADHWVFQALKTITLADSKMNFYETAPLSVAEIKFYMSNVDYESLSKEARILYDQLNEYLNSRVFSLNKPPINVGINLLLTPTFLFKSNEELEWAFASTYAGNSYKLYDSEGNYTYKTSRFGNQGAYNFNPFIKHFITAPVYIDVDNHLFIQTEPSFGKSYWGMIKNDSFINLPFSGEDLDFLWPKVAYFNAGYLFNSGWGINLLIQRAGFQIGDTLTGSIIYNDSFETDVFCNLSVYSKYFKYNLSLIEVNNDRFMYLHKLDAVLLKRFKFSFLEGTFINHSFELRYLNPLMIMHSFGSWRQYRSDIEYDYYDEAHVCAYLGILGEIVPFDNFRIYGLFSQNEIQSAMELNTPYGKSLPDGIGFQLGAEYNLADKNNGWWTFAMEGVYTSPYLYLKQGREWSLISYRTNMQSNSGTPLYSWIGSPFGPDCLAFESKISYKKYDKWGVDFKYLFTAHGENTFAMLDATYTNEKGTFWAYYPSVLRKLGILSDEESEKIARSMKLTGTLQYQNQFSLSGFYRINNHFKLDADVNYTFIFNAKNINDNFVSGLQLYGGVEYKLF